MFPSRLAVIIIRQSIMKTRLPVGMHMSGIRCVYETDVTFTVHLKNPKAATLADDGDTIEVSLYNTNSADRKNLATLTYLPDAEDASDRLVMSDEALAPAEGDTVLAEVVENDGETVEALDITPVLGDAESQPMTRTFLYGDALQFGSNQGSWKQYARCV